MRMLVRALVFLGSAALGLLAAALILDDVEVTASGFVVTAVIFAVVQSLVTPLLEKVDRDKASALLGGVGVVAALGALLVASLVRSEEHTAELQARGHLVCRLLPARPQD